MTSIKKTDHFYLIDGSGYIFRAYYALPPLSRKSDGLPTGAVSGFCSMLFKLLEDARSDDSKNKPGKIRSGRELVRADEYPDHDYPSLNEGRYAGVIGVGGLLLARIPEEVAKSREEYFSQKTADGNEAISTDLLKEQHPSMPINEDRQTRVTFGGSNKD